MVGKIGELIPFLDLSLDIIFIDFLINIVEGSALTSTQVETKPKYFLLKPTMEGHLHVAAQVDALSPTNPDVETLRRLPPTTVQSLDPKLPPVQLSDLG